MILAPLRGVTVRCFRQTFAEILSACGFSEAITPFIPAMPGLDPLKDRELRVQPSPPSAAALRVTPQFIGKDPEALRACLRRIREAGYGTADLNCGCPYPMVRNKGRGSGLLRTPDVLRRMLEVGCEEMGPGRFSVKTRLGVERPDELLALMPMINAFPLRFLTVHARTARQMYGAACDWPAFRAVQSIAQVPLIANGDLDLKGDRPLSESETFDKNRKFRSNLPIMVGRAFVRFLGTRPDAVMLLVRYAEASAAELGGDRPVLGRLKELLAYWKDQPAWRRRWTVLKMCRSLDEFLWCLDSP